MRTTSPAKIEPIVSYEEWRDNRSDLMTEVRSQYDEALSIMGTLVQKAAIMVAISSMLLFELFRMQTSGIIYNIGLITLATDCIIGFFITFQGRHINMGINPKLAIRLFEEGAFDKFHSSMIFKKYTALRDLSSTLERINLLIIVQFFLTGIGFISVILMEVRNVI